MAERLIVISDMWGAKKGIWATSYLVYLQQYFDVTYYDSQQLANIDLVDNSGERLKDAFLNGGVDKAIAQLMLNEKEPCHYVGFGIGGTIAWQANLQGLPMKSLYMVSTTPVGYENNKLGIPTKMVYGELDANLPPKKWFDQIEEEHEIIKGFGHDLYTYDTNIKKIAQDLLSLVTNKIKTKAKVIPIRKPLLVS
ncbi:hypothetical protein [Maribacter arenosus]|uniref:Alpha/beta hydrolase family protein n=1 Tax=Maribacter arenosus TaxID=1854708 RepID=A0ABR7VAE3_9FLAO|nr:hypothetical protein [Maribacter arenosus]MBD0850629.1 hypothetical protein [Maribacter arenosus]